MRVKYLAQEHNALPRPGLEPGPFAPESSALTIGHVHYFYLRQNRMKVDKVRAFCDVSLGSVVSKRSLHVVNIFFSFSDILQIRKRTSSKNNT